MFIAQNRKELNKKVMHWKPKNVSMENFKKLNFQCIPDECRQKIQQYTKLGVAYFMLFFGDLPNLNGVRLFADTVIKTVKST